MLFSSQSLTSKIRVFSLICSLGLASAQAATVTINTLSGNSAPVNGALDGVAALPDQWFGTNYNGYVGELGIIFNPTISSTISGTPTGMFRGDTGDVYAGRIGSYCFCVDSDTSLLTSSSPAQTYNLDAVSVANADVRFATDGVQQYLTGSLYRAAYLIETFAATRFAGGDIDGAALQEAVWEVLYDASPNLLEGQGNYFVRSSVSATALSVATLGNDMLTQAAADNWGGPGYNPTNVVVWMDPSDALLNQSVMSYYPPELRDAIPEPASVVCAIGGLGLAGWAARRRKNSAVRV